MDNFELQRFFNRNENIFANFQLEKVQDFL